MIVDACHVDHGLPGLPPHVHHWTTVQEFRPIVDWKAVARALAQEVPRKTKVRGGVTIVHMEPPPPATVYIPIPDPRLPPMRY